MWLDSESILKKLWYWGWDYGDAEDIDKNGIVEYCDFPQILSNYIDNKYRKLCGKYAIKKEKV